MTIARAHQVVPSVTRWHHCVTRCVRRAFLLGEGPERPQGLDRQAAGGTCSNLLAGGWGFSVLDNHLHVLVRLDADVAKGWSDEEVVRRWGLIRDREDLIR